MRLASLKPTSMGVVDDMRAAITAVVGPEVNALRAACEKAEADKNIYEADFEAICEQRDTYHDERSTALAEVERLRAKLDEALVAKTRKVVECGVLAGKLHLAEQQRDQWAKDFGDKSEEQADGAGRESVLRARVEELEAALRGLLK